MKINGKNYSDVTEFFFCSSGINKNCVLTNVHLILAENTTFIKKKPNQAKKGVSVCKQWAFLTVLWVIYFNTVYSLASAWDFRTFLASVKRHEENWVSQNDVSRHRKTEENSSSFEYVAVPTQEPALKVTLMPPWLWAIRVTACCRESLLLSLGHCRTEDFKDSLEQII